AAMPARRSSSGTWNRPWSLAYLSRAATPASATSTPILTGTLPTVNQRFTVRSTTFSAFGRRRGPAIPGDTGVVARAAGSGGGIASLAGACATAAAGVASTARGRTGSATAGPDAWAGAGRPGAAADTGAAWACWSASTARSRSATRRFRPSTANSSRTSATGTASTAKTTSMMIASKRPSPPRSGSASQFPRPPACYRSAGPGRRWTPCMPFSCRSGSIAAAPGRYCADPPWPVERPSAPAHPAGPAGALAPLRRKEKAPALPGLSVPLPTLLLGGDDADHLQALVGVAPLVVVPGHQLDEGRVELDAGVGIEDRGAGVAAAVGGDHLVLGVAEDALQRAFALRLDLGLDLLVGRRLLQLGGQVDHRHVRGRDAERHAGQLLVQRRDHHAHGLRRAGAGRDDVLEDAAAAAPVLVGRAVDGLLGRGGGVHGGHQATLDAPLVVDDLGQRRQAVGGAAGVGDDRLAG